MTVPSFVGGQTYQDWLRVQGIPNDALLVAQRVNRERIVLLSWGRAVLLQLAHPLVAAGVAEHSHFRDSTAAMLTRVSRTVGAMLAFTFGPPAAANRAARHILHIHRRVHGTLTEDVGPYRAGTFYTAEDPALLTWVHASLIDSVLLAYETLVAPLSPAERDLYCQASRVMEYWLQVPAGTFPGTWDELRRYLATMFISGHITVSATARALARHLLWPPLPPLLQPAAALLRLVTLGWLPAPIRADYGFPTSAGEARRLRMMTTLIRMTLPLWPARLRFWPHSDAAMRMMMTCPWHS